MLLEPLQDSSFLLQSSKKSISLLSTTPQATGDLAPSYSLTGTAYAMISWIGSAPSTPTSFWSRPL